MEQDMLAVCERIMHHKLGPRSRFFDHGLNSISAMKLAFELKQRGLDVEVTDVVREQTVANLARCCASKAAGGSGGGGPVARGGGEAVVRLSSAHSPSRQAPCAVVLVHGASGALAEMRLLAKQLCALNESLLIFGVHLIKSSVVKSVQQLAFEHIAALKRVCGSVPFVLVGSDVAGAVAYEMAHQLTRGGDQVCELVLLGRPFIDERAYEHVAQEVNHCQPHPICLRLELSLVSGQWPLPHHAFVAFAYFIMRFCFQAEPPPHHLLFSQCDCCVAFRPTAMPHYCCTTRPVAFSHFFR
jgi:aryl carrier-like protein